MAAPRATPEEIRDGLRSGPYFTDARSRASQWAGRATISSGQETVTVSTFLVNSDSIIRYGVQMVDVVGSLANAFCVRSISPGNFFTFGTADSQPTTRDAVLMWEIVHTS